MTLACEDAYSKLVEVVTVADISDEDRVGNSLLQIWELRIVHKAKLLIRLSAQDLVKILKLATDVWLRLRAHRYAIFICSLDAEICHNLVGQLTSDDHLCPN